MFSSYFFSFFWINIQKWNCLVVLFLIFWGASILFSMVDGCTDLHSHQQCTRVPFSSHPHQHLLLLVFLIIAIWQVWGDTSLWFLICISLMINDIAHIFMGLLATCISSLEKFYSNPFPIFELGFLGDFCIFGILTPYRIYNLQIFSPIQ